MSQHESLMAEEDEEFIRPIMYLMIVWILVVVVAGVALVLLRDPFASLFALSAVGF
ncbi:hypothetical protein OB905_00835 [Halobacteria archaeon AArc-dxtr1]|nr:hypothetical protein [Halobacteria archaeon AArc-dxtr1]